MALLCQLVESPGQVLSRAELEQGLGGIEPQPLNGVPNAVRELRLALGDDVHGGRYIETVTGRGYRLVSTAGDDPAGQHTTASESGLWQSFWQELQQRRVFRTAVAYVVAAWALLQVIDIVYPLFGVPESGMALTFLAMLAGFPLVLLLSWTLQWGAKGLRFDSPMARTGPPGFRRLSLAVALVLTALFSLFVWQSWEQLRLADTAGEQGLAGVRSQAEIPDNSIAVLRFVNLSSSSEDEYFSDGLSEELLNVLARLRELKVASRTSSWSLPPEMDVSAIRERLQVGYVLEGSIRRSGDLVRITAQFIDTGNGYHLWSDTFDRDLEDIFKVQDEVARKITDALQIILSDRSQAYLKQSPLANVEVYDAYLHGLAALRKPREGNILDEAEGWFEQASSLEPGFAGAWAGLCKTHLARYRFSRAVADFEHAETACHRTLTLDESSPDVFEALGALYFNSGQLEKAMRNYDAALVLAPNSVEALVGLGNTRARMGQAEEAEAYLQQAVTQDPGYWSAQNALGGFYFTQGHAEKAVAPYRRVTLLAPDYVIGHNNLGAAHMLTGSFDQAVAAFADALALGPDRNAYSNAGTAQYFLRQFDAAAEMYRNAISLSPENYQLWGHLGDALLAAGSSAPALEAYRRAAQLAEGVRAIDASDPTLQVSLARYYGNLERDAEARALLDDIDVTAADMYVYYDMSLAFIAVGELSNAIQALRQSLAAGYEASLIEQDPGFDALRQQPEFDTLLQSVP